MNDLETAVEISRSYSHSLSKLREAHEQLILRYSADPWTSQLALVQFKAHLQNVC